MNAYTESRAVRFGDRVVGDGQPCFITYEAGPTHDSLESAKALVAMAAESGADAVKFQIFDAERLVADKKQQFSYDILIDRESGETRTVEESLFEILRRRQLKESEWLELKKFSDSLDMAFFATIGFEEDLDLLVKMNCDSVKIASADVNHLPLIRQAAQTGMCIQLDTGNASLGEIETAVDTIRTEGSERIIIHQCPSGYPARLPSINLRIIETLRQMFPFPIAYSDHTPGSDMDIAAMVLGANLVEKTITFDRCTPSVEHIFSLEPAEAKSFIQQLRDVETAMGGSRRILHPEELSKRNNIRRSAFLRKGAEKGTRLADLEIEFRRPGSGVQPDLFEQWSDARLVRALDAGSMIRQEDVWNA
ncbi:MAG: N-acetylneuraminate synthase [Phycisphaerae bacterium]|nr:N-acetylneuraminate synthase [Phycisphaerae bacterium]|tara:strand:+ start:334 stop:1425 length:1092 start_codon:yes stop_codon:yes gene_type:complete